MRKSEKIEKYSWLTLLVLVVGVFSVTFIRDVITDYEDGHKNIHTVKAWMPEGAKIVTSAELEGITALSNTVDRHTMAVYMLKEYEDLTIGQTTYAVLNQRINPSVDYWTMVGKQWVHCCQTYEVNTGAASVTSMTYVGNGILEIRTAFNVGSLIFVVVWDMAGSLFKAIVFGVVVLLVCFKPVGWLMDRQERKEEEEYRRQMEEARKKA